MVGLPLSFEAQLQIADHRRESEMAAMQFPADFRWLGIQMGERAARLRPLTFDPRLVLLCFFAEGFGAERLLMATCPTCVAEATVSCPACFAVSSGTNIASSVSPVLVCSSPNAAV